MISPQAPTLPNHTPSPQISPLQPPTPPPLQSPTQSSTQSPIQSSTAPTVHSAPTSSASPLSTNSSLSSANFPSQSNSSNSTTVPPPPPPVFLAVSEPKTAKQALKDPNWLSAMQAEYQALLKNQTWSLVTLPPHRKAIGCQWIFRLKEIADGSINKYKARLVAKGFHQVHGFDFHETFSPVIKQVTICLILTLAITNKWPIKQLDVNNAFLNGTLDK